MKHDRNLHSASRQAGHGRPKRIMTVQQALEWAFRTECAQLELPEPPDPERGQGFGFGLEYVLMQRAALGCKIDGGRYKLGDYTHEDAEVIAATVSGMPDSLGGKRMAIRVAELARAGLTPDWMPGAVPRCVPVEMKRNRHGDHATTVVVGTERVLSRGKWRTVEVRACPVMFRPDARQIEGARQAYDAWRKALTWTKDGLIAGRMLREIELNHKLPVAAPWSRFCKTVVRR
jgi:hypothetical protein